MTGHCFKCKKKIEIKDGKTMPVPRKHGCFMLKGVCPECGTVVCKFLGRNKPEEEKTDGQV